MNREKLEELRDWLNDGAPEVVFDMRQSIDTVFAAFDYYAGEGEKIEFIKVQRDKKGLGDCGTVCCIAGFVESQVAKREERAPKDHWGSIAYSALNELGLEATYDYHFKHPLFSSKLAPDLCTPQEAARAVQNLLDGVEPKEIWNNVRKEGENA